MENKTKMEKCEFCETKENIIITKLERNDNDKKMNICHVCFNKAVRLDGLPFSGTIIRINLPIMVYGIDWWYK